MPELCRDLLRDLPHEELDAGFELLRRTADPDGPAIAEPAPSLTRAVGPAAGDGQSGADLTMAVLRGLRRVTRPGEQLYAPGPPRSYEHDTFDPRRLGSSGRDSWAVPVYPADSITVIPARDLRFGAVGNPVDKSPCVSAASCSRRWGATGRQCSDGSCGGTGMRFPSDGPPAPNLFRGERVGHHRAGVADRGEGPRGAEGQGGAAVHPPPAAGDDAGAGRGGPDRGRPPCRDRGHRRHRRRPAGGGLQRGDRRRGPARHAPEGRTLSVQAIAKPTEVLARLDAGGLGLVVADVDGSLELCELPEFEGEAHGAGETAWVRAGEIVATSGLGLNTTCFEPNTLALLSMP